MYNFSYVLVYVCPNLVSIALINTMTISNVGEERIKLAYIYPVSQFIEGNQGRK